MTASSIVFGLGTDGQRERLKKKALDEVSAVPTRYHDLDMVSCRRRGDQKRTEAVGGRGGRRLFVFVPPVCLADQVRACERINERRGGG